MGGTPREEEELRTRPQVKHTLRDLQMTVSLFGAGGGGLTPQQAAVLRAKIEQERLELLGKKDLVQSERDKAQQELERRENEIKKAQLRDPPCRGKSMG